MLRQTTCHVNNIYYEWLSDSISPMKRLLVISGIIVGVLLLVIIAVPLFINVDSFRPDLEKKLSAALNRQVHIGKLDASLLSGGASASDITIADDPAFNKGPFLKAASVKVGVQLMPLIFSKQLKVTSLTDPEAGHYATAKRSRQMELLHAGRYGGKDAF